MCYLVYISTDFEGDISKHNSPLMSFDKDFANVKTDVINVMRHQYKWYVRSKSGCSCTFRHLLAFELGFAEPVDWYEEGADEIEATQAFYDVVAHLISAGYQVDCIAIWVGAKADQIHHLEVDLSSISREAFRFFENHHFVFSNAGDT